MFEPVLLLRITKLGLFKFICKVLTNIIDNSRHFRIRLMLITQSERLILITLVNNNRLMYCCNIVVMQKLWCMQPFTQCWLSQDYDFGSTPLANVKDKILWKIKFTNILPRFNPASKLQECILTETYQKLVYDIYFLSKL